MLKKVLLVVAAALILLVAVIATRPSDFRVQRSATLNVPPAVVFQQIADFGRWAAWSPWAKLDPAMRTNLTGAPASVGHSYTWTGNDKVGEGRMTIIGVEPARQVEIKLEFLKPWESTSPSSFTLAPEGTGTRVTWTMSGHSNFVMKAMSLFTDMDQMIGGDFERGLAAMKSVAEVEAAKAAAR